MNYKFDGSLRRASSRSGALLVCATLTAVLMASVAVPAWADGGKGGNSGAATGGAGGTGFTGNPGSPSGTIAGGGGGGAGGGAGGSSSGIGAGGGGAGGTLLSPDGQTGGNATAAALGGGGGGGGGFNGGLVVTFTNSSTLSGGNGGRGGNGPSSGTGGGGGGGAGGYGLVVIGNGSNSNSGTISGGKGGAGGNSGGTTGDFGGNGGDGGVGIQFTSPGATLTNSGTISGGNGGAGGTAVSNGSAGSPGAGGTAIVGSSLTVTNSGTITGGVGGDGTTRANAISFTAGTNTLELQAGSTIVGNVVDATNNGTFRLGGSATGTFDASSIGPAAQYQGFSTFIKTGTSTWNLGGTTTAVTPWTINQGTLAIISDGSLGASSGGLTFDGGTLQFLGSTTSTRSVTINAGGATFYTVGTNATIGGPIGGVGGLTKTGLGTVTLSGTSSYLGPTLVDFGVLQAGATNAFSPTSAFTLTSGGTLDLNNFDQTIASVAGAGKVKLGSATLTTGSDNTNTTLSGVISGSGGLTKVGTGTSTLSGANTYTGATNVNVGILQAGAVNTFASGSAFTVAGGATLDLNGFDQSIGSLAGAGAVSMGAGTLTVGNDNTNTTFSGGISGSGGLNKTGTGILTLSGTNSYTGPTSVQTGTLQAGAVNAFAPLSDYTVVTGATLDLNNFDQTIHSLAGAGSVTLGSATLDVGSGNTNTTFGGAISGSGGLTKSGTGTLTLTGPSTYNGATHVNNGSLIVNGSIGSSAVTINSGATLGGAGTVGSTTVNSGATLAPGNPVGTLNVNGTLTFNPGGAYAIDVTPATADKTAVTGTASLAGAANATFQSGSYAPKSYTVLTSAGLGGTKFDTFNTLGLPSGFSADLGYTTTDVLLTLTATLGKGAGLNTNQQAVANALNTFFNGGGSLPQSFLDIYSLSGNALKSALTVASGETVTGADHAAFQLMGQFLGVLLDPFAGRMGPNVFEPGTEPFARGFAPERADNSPIDAALAYASTKRHKPYAEANFQQRWSVWSAGYGGVNNTTGDAGVGSHDTATSTYGIVVGADYRFTPDTVVGFAVGGGATKWDVTPGLGGGTSDAFQLGLYGATRSGPIYLATDFGFANHWVATNRTSVGGDRVTANFIAQSYGARIESGYEMKMFGARIAPYAAIQAQSYQLPGYSETDTDAGGFGLNYAARSSQDVRGELGGRFEHLAKVTPDAVVTVRTRFAWAHDWITDPSAQATFQSLPGASFTVMGAKPAEDSFLASGGFDLQLRSGITLLTKFDGEFSGKGSTYAGTGTLRYRW